MGTLDEAIREHLELKRRAGAPDTEVERLESEALGASRREAPAAEAPDLPRPPAQAPDLPPPPTEPPGASGPPDWVGAPGSAVPPLAPPPAPTGHSWLEDDEDGEDDPLAPEVPAASPQSTDEFTAGEAREASGAPPADFVDPDEEGDDLLEETPDFLQETPEHDRLWFEQKPPRDFDFDS